MSTELKKVRLAQVLRAFQAEQGLSARELARRIKLNPTSLGNYLDGTSYPTPESREKIAKALRLTPTELERYLDDVPLQPIASLDQTLQDIRAMNPDDFQAVVEVVFARIQDDLRRALVPTQQ